MSSEIIVTGVTFSNPIVIEPPAIGNLKHWAFYGTRYDGINTNRVPGGAAISPLGTPMYAENYVTVGSGIGGTGRALNTSIIRDTTAVTGGFTLMGACRIPESGNPSTLFQDVGSGVNTGGSLFLGPQNNCGYGAGGSGPGVLFGTDNPHAVIGSGTTLNGMSPLTNWHMVSMTYTGGSGASHGTITLGDLTSGLSLNITPGAALSPSITPLILGYDSVDAANFYGTLDLAWSMISFSYIPFSSQSGIYASVKSILARRGIAI